jgi:hypothetical protein
LATPFTTIINREVVEYHLTRSGFVIISGDVATEDMCEFIDQINITRAYLEKKHRFKEQNDFNIGLDLNEI